MTIYMSREGWDPINRYNHGDLYVKKGLLTQYIVVHMVSWNLNVPLVSPC